MKKQKVSIYDRHNTNGTHSILLYNVGLDSRFFDKLKDIVRHFSAGDTLFLGHYKLDGINISRKEFLKYGIEIPIYFKTNGQYQQIATTHKKGGGSCPFQELTVCCAPNNSETYLWMDRAFHYHLETIVFSPKIDWETFINSYKNYMMNITDDYVLNGYTDFLFSYVDSGDFLITFDPTVYNPTSIRKQIEGILLSPDETAWGQGDGSVVPPPKQVNNP